MIRLIVLLLAVTVAAPASAVSQGLADPAALNEQAPATYHVKFDTSKGPFVVEVHRDLESLERAWRRRLAGHYLMSSGSATRPTSGTPVLRMTASTRTTVPYGTPWSARR